jgi:intein/homing endonuclease
LIGAYAAEGAMTDHQLSISNNDASYFEPIIELCERWNITTKIYKHENKNETGWTSQDLRIYNTLLCKILEKLVGKLSHNKFISDIITFSNKDCLRGFLDAYIGGDGSVNKTSIFMHSTSKIMLKSVQIILRAFGVFSYINKPTKQETNNRGSLDIKQMYKLCIYGEQSRKLANFLNIRIDYKQDNLALIKIHDHKTKYGKRFEKKRIKSQIVMVITIFALNKPIAKSKSLRMLLDQKINFMISIQRCYWLIELPKGLRNSI